MPSSSTAQDSTTAPNPSSDSDVKDTCMCSSTAQDITTASEPSRGSHGRYTCMCPMHLGLVEGAEYENGKPMLPGMEAARTTFAGDDGIFTDVWEGGCTGTAIQLSLQSDHLPGMEDKVVGRVTRRMMEERGLWGEFQDKFRRATTVELGFIDNNDEFDNMMKGSPILTIDHTWSPEQYRGALKSFFIENSLKGEWASWINFMESNGSEV